MLQMDAVKVFPPLPVNDDVSEWTYEMRREMQEIVPGLFLGPYLAASRSKFEQLRENNITHIVCIRQQLESHFIRPNFPHLFRYLELDIADNPCENIIQHIPIVARFLDDCFARGHKVLVHGNAGISRSASLVIAYVMEKFGLSYRDAFSLVQQRRFCISPSERFAQQLREYEPIYRAKCSVLGGNCFNGRLKRTYDCHEEQPPDDVTRRDLAISSNSCSAQRKSIHNFF